MYERGTAGRIGISAAYASVAAPDELQGSTYRDQSSFTYSHQTQPTTTAATATVRYGFDASTVAWLDVGQFALNTPLTCRIQSGPTPCGYGPSNWTDETVRFLQLRESTSLAQVNLDAHVFLSQTSDNVDFANRWLYGMPSPIVASNSTSRVGIQGTATWIAPHDRAFVLDFTRINEQSGAFDAPASTQVNWGCALCSAWAQLNKDAPRTARPSVPSTRRTRETVLCNILFRPRRAPRRMLATAARCFVRLRSAQAKFSDRKAKTAPCLEAASTRADDRSHRRYNRNWHLRIMDIPLANAH